MRIATMILSLILMLPLFLQSCTLYALGGLANKGDISSSFGILAALCWLLGGAFVLRLPGIAMCAYLFAALLSYVGFTEGFVDLKYWCGLSVVFAMMALVTIRVNRAVTVED